MPPLRNLRPRTAQERRAASATRIQRFRRSCPSTRKTPRNYNIGRYFRETTDSICLIFDIVRVCSYCHARLFCTEKQGTCCGSGKIR